ncbi:MAG: TIGR00730 family Rossman fold protein [Sphingobacteriia bacterium]|nr:TIGR00730 family Rossman fold protein [Sphingobacteriia bacterium]
MSLTPSKKNLNPDKKYIGVFCSADDKISNYYKQEAFKLGELLATSNHNLLTGGSKTGLMKEVVDGFVTTSSQDNIVGVLPNVQKGLDICHPSIKETNLFWCESMHLRLAKFHELCEGVIVLPGGFGTLHELLDFLVSKQIQVSKVPIIIVNINGYWDHFFDLANSMIKAKALAPQHLKFFRVVYKVEDAVPMLLVSVTSQGLTDRYWEISCTSNSDEYIL